jgi:hypothetical protein
VIIIILSPSVYLQVPDWFVLEYIRFCGDDFSSFFAENSIFIKFSARGQGRSPGGREEKAGWTLPPGIFYALPIK